MSVSKTIAILGGGMGGVASAISLREMLPDEYRVILINRNETFCFSASLPWLLIGERDTDQITRSLDALVHFGIEMVYGEISKIDPHTRSVVVNQSHVIQADYLIIALGAEYHPEAIPGLETAGVNIYSLSGVQQLQSQRQDLANKRIVLTITGIPFKCPAAPYEIAMLLVEHIRDFAAESNGSFAIYSPEPGPMSLAGPEVSNQLLELVSSKNINYFPNHQVKTVDSASKTVTFDNQEIATFDILLYVPPHRIPSVLDNTGLLSPSGWIKVDPHLLSTDAQNVFAIGDATGIPLKVGKPLPKAGVFAHRQAQIVANNIACDLGYAKEKLKFDGTGECYVEVGKGSAAFGVGKFYSEPVPQVELEAPSQKWHSAKVALEDYWLNRWF